MTHACISLTAWFKSAALGVHAYEVLSRASAFLAVRSGELYLVSSAHVTHPFAYPHFFPEKDWLSALNADDLRYSLEVRDAATGGALHTARLPALRPLARHPRADVSAVALPAGGGGGGGGALLAALGGGAASAPRMLARARPADGAPLTVHGHSLVPRSGAGGEDTSALLPRVVPAALLGRSPAGQCFLRTAEVLEFGSCGGPVVDGDGDVVALVEGIVPQAPPRGAGEGSVQARASQLLGGCAVVVEAQAIEEALTLAAGAN
jgi:hypothetical protein